MNTKGLKTVFIHLILAIVSLLVFFPVLWMVSTSLRLPDELFTSDLRIIPHKPTLSNFKTVWFVYPLLSWFVNSTVTTTGITLGQLFCGLLAAYCFARYEFPGKSVLFFAVVGTLIVPYMVTLLPNYILISKAQLLDTWWSVIIPYLPAGLATFLLRQFILMMPRELFDAAEIDGANSWKTLWLVVVPNIVSGIVVVIIIVGINAWNIYFWPLLVLTEKSAQTIPIGLRSFMDVEAGYQWGELMAGASLATIPLLIIYFITQKHIISSFVTSGVKG